VVGSHPKVKDLLRRYYLLKPQETEQGMESKVCSYVSSNFSSCGTCVWEEGIGICEWERNRKREGIYHRQCGHLKRPLSQE
jgi:hypothetical protein